jgi:phosphatidylserine decarboxylase
MQKIIHFIKIKFQISYSYIIGKLCDFKINKKILELIVKCYIKIFKCNLDDFEIDIKNLTNFNEFFTRKLKKGLRNFDSQFCSPAEGYISEFGIITDKGQLCQVKGNYYNIKDLLYDDNLKNLKSYLTIYLSPADYHRVHAPFNIKIQKIRHIPGNLYSVNLHNAIKIKNLYCQNERIIFEGNSDYGNFALIMVAAIGVGNIKVQVGNFEINDRKIISEVKYDNPIKLQKGEEIGIFQLGSTVILITENDTLKYINKKSGDRILLGETLV